MSAAKFILNKTYSLHAEGFDKPIVGRIVGIDTVGTSSVLVVKTKDGEKVNVFVSAITGWSEVKVAA